MARPIDAYQAIDIIDEWLDSVGTVMVGKGLSSYGELIGCIEDAPTLTPPNELLTLDQLREMDGKPVWVELYRAWALVEVKQNGSIMFYGNSFSCPYSRTWKVYRFRPDRRPPEGEA